MPDGSISDADGVKPDSYVWLTGTQKSKRSANRVVPLPGWLAIRMADYLATIRAEPSQMRRCGPTVPTSQREPVKPLPTG